MEILSDVLEADKSDEFSRKYEATLALSDIVKQDPIFDISPDSDVNNRDFDSGIRRVPTGSFDNKTRGGYY